MLSLKGAPEVAGNQILVVYPYHGNSGIYVKHGPLALLYVSSELVKFGYDEKIFDTKAIREDSAFFENMETL